MASLAGNALTIIRNPAIGMAYARWAAMPRPSLRLPWGDHLTGFRHFSEYLSARHDTPSEIEVSFVRDALRDGGIAFDVGANIGSFSLLMAHCGASAVHAFEPLLSTWRILCKNVRNHSAIVAHNWAMSETCGMARFTDLPGQHAENHLSDRGPILVETTTLDASCSQNGIDRIAFAKIDVEGCEPMVLRGAAELLRRHAIDSLLIEIIPDALRARDSSLDELIGIINGFGYAVDAVDGNNFAVRRSSP